MEEDRLWIGFFFSAKMKKYSILPQLVANFVLTQEEIKETGMGRNF